MSPVDTSARHGYRPLVGLGSRLAGVQLAQVALTTTDLVVMGSLGMEALAAGGLAALLYNQVRTMCVGMVTPTGNLVAQAVGRHDAAGSGSGTGPGLIGEVRAIVRAAFTVATITGFVAAGVVVGLGLLLPWLGQDESIVSAALPVMAALAPGLIPMLWLQVLRQYAVGMHRAGSLLGVTIAAIAMNLLLDGGFVYGWFGLPVLGLAGIGLATTLVQLLSFLAYLVIVVRDPHLTAALSLRAWRAERRRIREIIRLGTPLSLTYASEAGITSVATIVMGTFGPVALAAHNLVNQISYIAYQLSIGVSQGASILVSGAVGRGDREEPTAIARRAFVLCGGIQMVLAIAYLTAPSAVLGLFLRSGDGLVLGTASVLLVIALAQQAAKGSQNIAVGLMRGLGDTKVGFRASLVGYWGVGVPAMLLCAYVLDGRAAGVWIGLTAGFAATGVQVLRRFLRLQRSGTSERLRATAPHRKGP